MTGKRQKESMAVKKKRVAGQSKEDSKVLKRQKTSIHTIPNVRSPCLVFSFTDECGLPSLNYPPLFVVFIRR